MKIYFFLGLVILFSFLIRIMSLDYNSSFLDEAIYIILGKEIFETGETSAFSWMGGMPFMYPVLTAAFFEFGIVGSRFLNAMLGTASVILMFHMVDNLKIFQDPVKNKSLALISAIFLSINFVHWWLSRIAIYDMLSFTFFITGGYFFVKGISKNNQNNLLTSGFFIFLSFLAKYTTMIFLPFILFIAFGLLFKKPNLKLGIIHFIFIVTLSIGGYFLINYSDLLTFTKDQALSAGQDPKWEIAFRFLSILGIFYILSIPAFFVAKKARWIILPLFLLSFVPIIANVYAQNSLTIEQNAVYSFLFLIPIVSVIFVFLIQKNSLVGVFALFLFTSLYFIYSLEKRWEMEHFWPNTNEAVAVLNENVKGNEIVLAESGDVIVLGLYGKISSENIISPFSFTYQGREGEEAFQNALKDSYFDLIQTDPTTSEIHNLIQNNLDNYETVYKEGEVAVYRKK